MPFLALQHISARLAITRYRTALWVFVFSFALYTTPFWLGGQVLAPSCRSTVLGVTAPGEQIDPCGLQKFADYETEFLPEIANQLRTPHSGVVALRSTATEFDRPAKHITGNTPANIYSWVFFHLSDDPVVVITLLTFSLAACAGVFTILLAREWQLAPIAGLGAAVLTSMGSFVSYWQTYPMHVATVCWSSALLWALVRWFRRGDVVAWFTLVFALYSIILMGYPQAVVYVAWMLGVLVVWKSLRAGVGRRIAWQLAVLGAAAVLALALAAPVLLDVAAAFRDSARVAAPDDYYLQYILRIKAPWVLVLYAALHTVPELYGTATDVAYPFRFDGFAVSSLPLWLIGVALRQYGRQLWGWALALGVLMGISVSPGLFGWLLHAVPGFGLSQWTPHWNATLPLTVLTMYGIHAVTDETALRGRHGFLLLALPIAALGAGVVVAGWYSVPIPPARLLCLLALVLLLAIWLWQRQQRWLGVALLLTILLTGYDYHARRDPATVVQHSALSDALQAVVPPGARLALVDPEIGYLFPPNFNRLYDIATVHTYNNFTPPAYQHVIAALGGKTAFYGKLNTAVAPNYDDPLFWMSNIGAVLAREPIEHPALRLVGRAGPVAVMSVTHRMGQVWHTPLTVIPTGQDIRFPTVRDRDSIPVVSYEDHDDHIDIGLTPQTTPSLVVLSLLQRPQWRATALVNGVAAPARQVSVNGVFVGVVVPPGTTSVRLDVTLAVRWMWVSHTVWLVLWLGYAVYGIRRWRTAPAA